MRAVISSDKHPFDDHYPLYQALTPWSTSPPSSLQSSSSELGLPQYLQHGSHIFLNERKRLSESEKLIAKYHDPLLLACPDLQSRLYNISAWAASKRKNLLLYPAFLI
jgi:hypothetical protein